MQYKLLNSAILCLCSTTAIAGPWGNDFGISHTAIGGGMGAATYANPLSASDAVFGNPATLVTLDETPRVVSFSAAYINIDFTLEHNGAVTGAPFIGESDTDTFLVPNFATVYQIDGDTAVGGGFGITAGLGADFRTDTPLSPAINYIAFGNNISYAKRLNENWSIGVTGVMGFGLMQVGPVQSSGTVYDIGFRGSIGVLYDNDNVSFSAHYNSALAFEFDNAFLITGSEFGDLPLEQPQEIVLGTSYRFAEGWDWQLAYQYKNWGDADGYEDIWEDQHIISSGIEYTEGAWSYRAGLGFTNGIRKDDLGSSFGGNTSLGFQGQTIPLSPPVVEFLQASLAPSFWSTHVGAGIGYAFNKSTRVDGFASTTFGSEEEISEMNTTDVDFIQLGAGLTWFF